MNEKWIESEKQNFGILHQFRREFAIGGSKRIVGHLVITKDTKTLG